MRISEDLIDRVLQWVMTVLDAGQDADSDSYFVVMPRAEGSLQQVIAQGIGLAEPEAIVPGIYPVSNYTLLRRAIRKDISHGRCFRGNRRRIPRSFRCSAPSPEVWMAANGQSRLDCNPFAPTASSPAHKRWMV